MSRVSKVVFVGAVLMGLFAAPAAATVAHQRDESGHRTNPTAPINPFSWSPPSPMSDPTFHDSSWPTSQVDSIGADTVKCFSAHRCIAWGSNFDDLRFIDPARAPLTWSSVAFAPHAAQRGPNVHRGTEDLSCPDPSFCLAVSSVQLSVGPATFTLAFSDDPMVQASWRSVVVPASSAFSPRYVACASSALCVAGDANTVWTTTTPEMLSTWRVAYVLPSSVARVVEQGTRSACRPRMSGRVVLLRLRIVRGMR